MLKIITILECAFCGMHSLEVLDLSFNQLLRIADGTLFVHQATKNPIQWINKHSISPGARVQIDDPIFGCFLGGKINCTPVIL